MSEKPQIGPGQLPMYEIQTSSDGLDLSQVGGFELLAGDLSAEAGFASLIDSWDGIPELIVILDEPANTSTRAVAALGLAGELIRQGKSVVILDGDDHLPDLTRWAGRLEHEGWIDVVRYGLSVETASIPLPWAPERGRFLGVGSYQPTRASADELATLLKILHGETDVVIACASAGDRGAAWAVQPSRRMVCWSPSLQTEDVVTAMVRDAGLLGERPRAVLVLTGRDGADVSRQTLDLTALSHEPRNSSPVFRRLVGLLGLLVIVLIIWWMGLFDSTDVTDQDLAQNGDSSPEMIDHSPRTVPSEVVTDTVAEPEADSLPVVSMPDTEAEDLTTEPEPSIPDDVVPEATIAETTVELVGAAGWCLHVYSFRDSSMATEEMTRMEARGVAGRMFVGTDNTNKTWYRVYAGSYASSGDAQAAIDDLCEQLKTDWAMPVRTDRIAKP